MLLARFFKGFPDEAVQTGGIGLIPDSGFLIPDSMQFRMWDGIREEA